MAYVQRNADGLIVAVSESAEGDCQEFVDARDPQLLQFIAAVSGGQGPIAATDQDFIRVLEDVVDLLIAKGVILFTDLPDSAQGKILRRQRLRAVLGGALDLLDGNDGG